MSMRKIFRAQISCLVLLLLGGCSTAVTAQVTNGRRVTTPVVVVPGNHQRIGEGDDALCSATNKACYKIRAEGRVPNKLTPFFAVAPVMASPTIWIQPVIDEVRRDGSFAGLVYLGEEHRGAGEHFKIYVFACKNRERFHEGDEIHRLPKDCRVSESVEVYRVR